MPNNPGGRFLKIWFVDCSINICYIRTARQMDERFYLLGWSGTHSDSRGRLSGFNPSLTKGLAFNEYGIDALKAAATITSFHQGVFGVHCNQFCQPPQPRLCFDQQN